MHGVAVLSKTEPVNVKNGLPVDDDDSDDVKSDKEKYSKEGRLITAEFEKFYLINACKLLFRLDGCVLRLIPCLNQVNNTCVYFFVYIIRCSKQWSC